MKCRYIGENARFIHDLMSYTEVNNLPGLLVFIDFEKAFDWVSWSFVYNVLHLFGFRKKSAGYNLRHKLKSFYLTKGIFNQTV